MKENRVKVTGKMEVKVKILNLSRKPINSEASKFHEGKGSSSFDNNINIWSFYDHINFDPTTGESIDKTMRVEGGIDIDFTFSEINDLDEIKDGDVVYALVDALKNGEDIGRVADKTGHAAIMLVDGFNDIKSHLVTHEAAHLIGDLTDMGYKGPEGYLMSYNGNGYKLSPKQNWAIVLNIIYQQGLKKNGVGHDTIDTRQVVEDLISKYQKR